MNNDIFPTVFLLFTMLCTPQNADCRPGRAGYYDSEENCKARGKQLRAAELVTDYQCWKRRADPR